MEQCYPTRPSHCVACVSLSEDGADHPYLSIFYSVLEDAIHFFGIPVTGTEPDEEGNKLLVYEDGITDPDEAIPLAAGVLTKAGAMSVDADPEVYLSDESEALNYIAIIRAMYRMREELAQ